MPTEVQQRPLLNLGTNPLALAQAVGDVGVAGFAALDGGAADEHSPTVNPLEAGVNRVRYDYGSTLREKLLIHCFIRTFLERGK